MKKILVIRNDKIGDFMLAWPSFAMLKASIPDCHITALVPSYTAALAKLCPWIDEVMLDPTKKGNKAAQDQLVQDIKQQYFDASINLFSTTYNAKLVWKAGIPYRLAPATKFAQVLYNRRVKQRRSRSEKPEYQYNLDLVRAFLVEQRIEIVEPKAPYLVFNSEQKTEQKQKLSEALGLSLSKPWVFVHAGSGGSANNLSLDQYSDLISSIDQDCECILTAGPGEEEQAKQLHQLIVQKGKAAVVYDKNEGLADFACSIACADAFMAGSTGPLHIAAAADVPTVGFFPNKRSSTPLRWLPINSEGRHIAFCPPAGKESEVDMSLINIDKAAETINPWLAQCWS